MRRRVREAVARAGGAHDVRDEGSGPGIVAVDLGWEDVSARVVLAGPRGLRSIRVLAEPPVFAYPLPKAGLSLGFVVAGRLVRPRWLVVDLRSEAAPLAERDRNRVLA